MCHMFRPSHPLWCDLRNDIWWGVHIVKFIIVQFSPVSCYFHTLRPKHLSHNPFLEHLQPVVFAWCETFPTHINKKTKLQFLISRYQTERRKILEWIVAGIPRIFSAVIFFYACNFDFLVSSPDRNYAHSTDCDLSLCCDFIHHSIN